MATTLPSKFSDFIFSHKSDALFRFKSTNNPEELTSLDEYISRMKDDQDTILYLAGDT